MDLPLTQESLDNVLGRIRNGIELLEKISGAPLPASLREAVDKDWSGAGEDVETIMGDLREEVVAPWKQRVISLPRALALLTACEDECVRVYVHEERSALQIAITAFVRKWKILVETLATFFTLIVPVLLELGKQAGTWLDASIRLNLAFWRDDRDDVREQLERKNHAEIWPWLLGAAIAGGIAAVTIRTMAGPIASAAAFKSGVRPIVEIRDSTLNVLRKNALPAGKPGRVRRRKRAR